ncbi:sugar isomerase domain-containing protein [Photobacterium sp. DNB23_23_1]
MFEYVDKVVDRIETLVNTNSSTIAEATEAFANAIIEDKMIHILGTGHSHMVGLEGFIRAGGIGNINAILDSTLTTSDGALRSSRLEKLPGLAHILWQEQNVVSGDIIVVISNSGRNTVPIEFAQIAKSAGHQVIAITSVEQSSAYPSLDQSGLKLMDIADIVLDNCVPCGDGLCLVNHHVTGAFSSISGIILMNTIITEAQKKAVSIGHTPLVFTSQNIDGYNNDDVYNHFRGRLKAM